MAFKRVIIPRVGPLFWLLGAMGKLVVSVITITLAVVLWLASCIYRNHARSSAFDGIATGEARAEVLIRLGSPDHIEPGWTSFIAYANSPCIAPCHQRLWWENTLLPRGFEAWSVDLDRQGRVLDKAHWSSP